MAEGKQWGGGSLSPPYPPTPRNCLSTAGQRGEAEAAANWCCRRHSGLAARPTQANCLQRVLTLFDVTVVLFRESCDLLKKRAPAKSEMFLISRGQQQQTAVGKVSASPPHPSSPDPPSSLLLVPGVLLNSCRKFLIHFSFFLSKFTSQPPTGR